MKTIFCATDFSENSKRAANWAAFLSYELDIQLFIYHCYHIPVIISDVPHSSTGLADIEDDLIKQMANESKRISKLFPGLEIQTLVEPGFPKERILVNANNQNAGLIVMGITGRKLAGQLLIGSTAISISIHSKIPVLIVPVQARPIKIINMALAYDLKGDENIADMELFYNLVNSFDANVDLVHISKNGHAQNAQSNFAAMIPKIKKYKHALHNVEDSSVEPGLVNFTKRNKIDVLAMIHKQHSFLEKFFYRTHTDKLAYQITIPLLVLHETVS